MDHPKELKRAVLSGTAWMVALRWAVRGLGVVSTVILARLLSPSDFGLVAMGALVVELSDILTSFSVDMALIQNRRASREHFDSAWTMRLLQVGAVGLLLIGVAPWVAAFYGEPRVAGLTIGLAIAFLITGFENVGVVAFRKELTFGREFAYRVGSKLGRLIIVVGLALWLRNYWALVYGSILARVWSVLLSYWMHPYRPRPTLSKARELWSFSQWMLVRNIAMYLRRQADRLMIGKYLGAVSLGLYSVGKEIAELPTTELAWPLSRVLFPALSSVADDQRRFRNLYLRSFEAMATLVLPIGVGLALLSGPIVGLLLGEKWIGAVPLFPWLCFYAVVFALGSSVQNPLMAAGHMRRVSALALFQTSVAVPVVWAAAAFGDLMTVAKAQSLTALVLLPVFFQVAVNLGLLRWRDVGFALWRPVCSAAVMAAVLGLAVPPLPRPWLEIGLKVLLGGGVYVLSMVSLWLMQGKPDGPEKEMLRWLIPERFSSAGSD